MTLEIYTDGACKGNPGLGGWGWAAYNEKGFVAQKYGAAELTTNNCMELTAIVNCLELYAEGNVEDYRKIVVYSDSSYSINCIIEWFPKWKKTGQVNRSNYDILEGISKAIENLSYKGIEVQFVKVKGHAGFERNEYADSLANQAILEFNNRKTPDSLLLSHLVVTIATGPYVAYLPGLINSLENYQPGDYKELHIFSDTPARFDRVHKIRIIHHQIEHQHWPLVALNKFRYILEAIRTKKEWTSVSYFDAKMTFPEPISFEVDQDTLYPCPHSSWGVKVTDWLDYTWGRGITPKSNAFLPKEFDFVYCQSCLMIGGQYAMRDMCTTCDLWTAKDLMHCVIPMWHDESYYNKYLLEPCVKTSYFPEGSLSEIGDGIPNPKFLLVPMDDIQNAKKKLYED